MVDCKKEENKKMCNCSFSCGKKGMCCDCIKYHKNLGELPACYFPNDVEKTGDRSIENFIRVFRERGKCW